MSAALAESLYRALGVATSALDAVRVERDAALKERDKAWRDLAGALKEKAPAKPSVSETSSIDQFKADTVREAHESGQRGSMAMLKKLLAHIHNDGGNHTEKMGLTQSAHDALQKVAALHEVRDAGLGELAEAHRRQRDEARLDYANTVSLAKRERALADDRVSELERERDTYEIQRDEARALLNSMVTKTDDRVPMIPPLQEPEMDDDMADGSRVVGYVPKSRPDGRGHLPTSYELDRAEAITARLREENEALKKQLEVSRAALVLRVEMHLALKKIDYVNEKLGIFIEDSFEHFREQLDNALNKAR